VKEERLYVKIHRCEYILRLITPRITVITDLESLPLERQLSFLTAQLRYKEKQIVRFQVITRARMKMAGMLCSLVKVCRRFRGEYRLHGGKKSFKKHNLFEYSIRVFYT
jgi:hypothetical protein